MTLFAGAHCITSTAEVPRNLKDALNKYLRTVQNEEGQRYVHDTPRFFLTKWDSGAFSEPAWRTSPDGSICAMVGDPLLTDEGRRLRREQQLARLAPVGSTPDVEELAQCRGSFTLVQYDRVKETLFLATDAVGLRSIYYVVQDGVVIFSTALRVLESIPEIGKTLSELGMAELCAFSFPLAERTPYNEISILRESAILEASFGGINVRNYCDWTVQENCPESAAEAAATLHDTFVDAVRIRAGDDKRVYSFLSGGMDSRAIVATLLDMDRQVEALNFSAPNSQDQKYAQMLAAEAGDRCRLYCLPGGSFPNFSLLALDSKTSLERHEAIAVDRRQMIWSGDGGSVGLGHVYMDEMLLEYCDRGDIKGAVEHFFDFNRIALPVGVLAAASRQRLPKMLLDSVVSEVNRYPVQDIGRRFYLFLLFNDQRRHLFKHFESIDQHGLELLTPFYDTKFLKAVAATPAHWGILHRLYAQWFQLLSDFALKTPWQTYPGHVPCPVPSDGVASYQWAKGNLAEKPGLTERVQLALALIKVATPETQLQTFSTSRVWLAAFLHALGLKDCSYILRTLQTYQHHCSVSASR